MSTLVPKKQYDEEFLARVKDLATLQLTPSMIADRLELLGLDRRQFLMDIFCKIHPLAVAYAQGLGSGYDDVMETLHATAVSGDTMGIDLLLRTRKEIEISELKKELFGI